VDSFVWSDQTLTELESDDWCDPSYQYPTYFVTNVHRLRNKPLREFTAEDLRFMLGQQISLPILMPMALDVLELENPFAGGDMNHGTLLYCALTVDKRFWQEHPRLWYRMGVVLVDLYSFREFIEQKLLPAARDFETAGPVIA
jgi:hypothetical protein